jgi:hypothetical protein
MGKRPADVKRRQVTSILFEKPGLIVPRAVRDPEHFDLLADNTVQDEIVAVDTASNGLVLGMRNGRKCKGQIRELTAFVLKVLE